MVHHRSLHRMQRFVFRLQVLHGEELLTVERGQELDARVDGPCLQTLPACIDFCKDDRAGTAVAFGATLLGAAARQIFTQILQHGARRIDVVQLDDFPIEHETYRVRSRSLLHYIRH